MNLEITKNDWKLYFEDPLPGWGNSSLSLFNMDIARLKEQKNSDIAIYSVPFDSTSFSRIGSRYGPNNIRQASLKYSAQEKSRNQPVLRNMRNGRLYTTRNPKCYDYGDLHVYPNDTLKQMQSIMSEAYSIALLSKSTIMLGGEHTLSFPNFHATYQAAIEKGKGKIGYIQIDNHFDFGKYSILNGEYYHGTNARKIFELPYMKGYFMGFVGVGDFTSNEQYNFLLDNNVTVKNMDEIRKTSFKKCLIDTLDKISENTDSLYISIDIDVCDNPYAPGTGHITIGGINLLEFMEIVDILKNYSVCALDIVEVNPQYDSSELTSNLVSRFLHEYIFFEELEDE